LPGLALAGNYLRGVGVPQCVHSGEQAAEALVNGRRL
jgi:oxygen-dependent protoporphyrinogen oxidase